jgi:flagellar motility protein MotE (MotC chaperone)
MKLSTKDLTAIAVVTLLSFPVMVLIVLFSTGNARFEFGRKSVEVQRNDDLRLINLNQRRDSLLALHSESYRAMLKQRDEVDEKERLLKERENRVAMLEQELEQQKIGLETERKLLEKAVAGSDSASEKKIRQLARVYGAMRPSEAAQILETLNDELTIKVIRGIGDERQKGKIMAALSKQKAARISKIMGAPVISK